MQLVTLCRNPNPTDDTGDKIILVKTVLMRLFPTCYGSIFSLLISLLDNKKNPPDKVPAKMQSDRTTMSSGINPIKER